MSGHRGAKLKTQNSTGKSTGLTISAAQPMNIRSSKNSSSKSALTESVLARSAPSALFLPPAAPHRRPTMPTIEPPSFNLPPSPVVKESMVPDGPGSNSSSNNKPLPMSRSLRDENMMHMVMASSAPAFGAFDLDGEDPNLTGANNSFGRGSFLESLRRDSVTNQTSLYGDGGNNNNTGGGGSGLRLDAGLSNQSSSNQRGSFSSSFMSGGQSPIISLLQTESFSYSKASGQSPLSALTRGQYSKYGNNNSNNNSGGNSGDNSGHGNTPEQSPISPKRNTQHRFSLGSPTPPLPPSGFSSQSIGGASALTAALSSGLGGRSGASPSGSSNVPRKLTRRELAEQLRAEKNHRNSDMKESHSPGRSHGAPRGESNDDGLQFAISLNEDDAMDTNGGLADDFYDLSLYR